MDFQTVVNDYLTVLLQMIAFEGLLSGENVLSLLAIVATLPVEVRPPWPLRSYIWGGQRAAALLFGILFAFAFRFTLLAGVNEMRQADWFRVLGGLGLIILAVYHLIHLFRIEEHAEKGFAYGFWSTLLKIEAIDVLMSFDNVLAATALTDHLWLIYVGVGIGIVMIRLGAMYIQRFVVRFPELKIAAYVILIQLGLFLFLSGAARYFGKEFHVPEYLQFLISGGIVMVVMGVARFIRIQLPVTGEHYGGSGRISLKMPAHKVVYDGWVEPHTGKVRLQLEPSCLWDHDRLLSVFAVDASISTGDLWAHWFGRRSVVERALAKIVECLKSYGEVWPISMGTDGSAYQRIVEWQPDQRLHPWILQMDFGLQTRLGVGIRAVLKEMWERASDEQKDVVFFVLTDGLFETAHFEELKDDLRWVASQVHEGSVPNTKIVFIGLRRGDNRALHFLDNLEEVEADVVDHVEADDLFRIADSEKRSRLLSKEVWHKRAPVTVGSVRVIADNGQELFSHEKAAGTIDFTLSQMFRKITVRVNGDEVVVKLPRIR